MARNAERGALLDDDVDDYSATMMMMMPMMKKASYASPSPRIYGRRGNESLCCVNNPIAVGGFDRRGPLV